MCGLSRGFIFILRKKERKNARVSRIPSDHDGPADRNLTSEVIVFKDSGTKTRSCPRFKVKLQLFLKTLRQPEVK